MTQILRNIWFRLDEEGNSRELSPLEIDAVIKYGDDFAERFPSEGPDGTRY